MEVKINLMSLVGCLDSYYKRQILEDYLGTLETEDLTQLHEDISLELAARSVDDAD